MKTRSYNKLSYESGNVIFIILIAIALLAALTFTVSKGNQGGHQTVIKDQAKLFASEISEYSQNIANAVAQLRLRGCSENQISFENNTVAGYENVPTNTSCQVFHADGGSVNWQDIQAAVQDSSNSSEWMFTGDTRIKDIGTTKTNALSSELMVILMGLTDSVCEQLNVILNVQATSIPADDEFGATKFTGSYDYNAALLIGDGAVNLSGKKSGCAYDASNSANVFYRVLIAR